MALANREVVVHIVISEAEALYLKHLTHVRPRRYEKIGDEPREEYDMRMNIWNVLNEVLPNQATLG